MLGAAFDALGDQLYKLLLASDDDDTTVRLKTKLELLAAVRAHLAAFVTDGKLADKYLEEIEGSRRRFKLRRFDAEAEWQKWIKEPADG